MVLIMVLVVFFFLVRYGIKVVSNLSFEDEEIGEDVVEYLSGYYYEQLSDEQQDYYKKLKAACLEFQETIDFEGLSLEEGTEVVVALTSDMPELFWIMGNYTIYYSNNITHEMVIDIPRDAREDFEQIAAKTDAIISDIPLGATEYDKIKYLYDWIVENVDYQYGERDQDVRSVFLDGKSVCSGYTKAFTLLCRKAGIRCASVIGEAIDRGAHAWNLVYIEDTPYWVDVTWGDPVFVEGKKSNARPNYIYLCMPDDDLFLTHSIDDRQGFENIRKWVYPRCTSNKYNYYVMNDMFFEEFDEIDLDSYLLKKIDSNELKDIEMQFGTRVAYEQAFNYLFEEEGVFDIVRKRYPTSAIAVEHISDETGKYIQLSITID